MRLLKPVFEGDTIYLNSEALEQRESTSRPDIGTSIVKTAGFVQEGKVVISFKRTIMVYKEPRSEDRLTHSRRIRYQEERA